MRHISKKTLFTALIAFGVFACATGTFFGGWWWINHLEQQLYDTKVAAKRADDERKQFASLEALALDTAADRARLETYIVADQGVISFLAELEQIARAEGVSPETRAISTEPISGETLFEDLVVTIGLRGEAEAVKEVVRRYERMPYQLTIQGFSMHGASSGTSADLTIRVTKFTP
jgi:hypothetical protein